MKALRKPYGLNCLFLQVQPRLPYSSSRRPGHDKHWPGLVDQIYRALVDKLDNCGVEQSSSRLAPMSGIK